MRYFIDCEFDGFQGPLISMALVRDDGRSIYFVIAGTEEATRDPWVIQNVLPILKDSPEPPLLVTRDEAGQYIASFLFGDARPCIVADWPDDIRHFCDLIVLEGGHMVLVSAIQFEVQRVDAYPTTLPGAVQHNAWWDATALRECIDANEEAEAKAICTR